MAQNALLTVKNLVWKTKGCAMDTKILFQVDIIIMKYVSIVYSLNLGFSIYISIDTLGCYGPDFCIPAFDGHCFATCPVMCKDDEMLCPGLYDPTGRSKLEPMLYF